MSDEVLNNALRNIQAGDEALETGQKLLNVLRSAGEDVAEYQAGLNDIKVRRDKMVMALKNAGAKV